MSEHFSSKAERIQEEARGEPKEPDFSNLAVVDRVMAGHDAEMLTKLKAFLRERGMNDADIERSVAAQKLRRKVHAEREQALEERLRTNPTPIPEELSMGAFLEMIEPQVLDAVRLLRRNGYASQSSGFDSFHFQSMNFAEPHFAELDAAARERLEALGVKIRASRLSFACEKIDLEEIKKKWDAVAASLPDLGHPAPDTDTPQAASFRRKYGKPKSA